MQLVELRWSFVASYMVQELIFGMIYDYGET